MDDILDPLEKVIESLKAECLRKDAEIARLNNEIERLKNYGALMKEGLSHALEGKK